ncbi:MAG: deaminase [archaeon]
MKEEFKRPTWEESFMFAAYSAAARSSCRHIHTGAVIVKDKRVIAMGYNGAPPGIRNCLEVGCRKDLKGIKWEEKNSGGCRGVHAEVNAMSQIARKDLKGTVLFTLYFPCSHCARAIVANGISEVVYSKIYKEPDSLTEELFTEAGVKLRRLKLDIKNQCNMILNVADQSSLL